MAREETFVTSLCRLFVIAYLTLLRDEEGQLAQMEDMPRGSLGFRGMAVAVRGQEKPESMNRRRAEAQVKICLELDWSVVLYPAVLLTPVPVSETVLHGRCDAHTKGTPSTMVTIRPSTSVHTYSEAHAGERAKDVRRSRLRSIPTPFSSSTGTDRSSRRVMVGEGSSTACQSWCRGWSDQAPRCPKTTVRPSTGLRSGRAHCAGGLAA